MIQAKQSYTFSSLLRLGEVESCLRDMQRSRDEVMENIEQVLKCEEQKLVMQRERSTAALRLSRYEKQIEKETKELEQDHRRIDELRENLRTRAAAMEEARKRYHTGNEYLEESLRKLERDREALSATSSRLCDRQRELIADLLSIYPIEPAEPGTLVFTIRDYSLPNSAFHGFDDERIATALGFTCHLVRMIAYYLEIPLRFPITPMSSRSSIRDPISASIPAPRQGYISGHMAVVAPLLYLVDWLYVDFYEGGEIRLVDNNQLGALFPLFARGVDRYRFEYGVFLLNKNIEQLMNSQGLLVMDLRHTLPNLKYLILALISTSNQQISHFRKFIPHICTMPNHTSYEENNSSRSSLDDHSGASKRSLAIPIPKSSASEAHRPRTGFGVGVT
ncbi:9964_t:CDS:10 [Paraglomus brasilianum]|uniref:Autophagy-related protein 14 n=1 Tax=Paraglomus brasilianum TaxID=144538 RepID=A0A9N9FLB8_9GLOM|nr:9964_t:CDS:10 [Paraglomus brasilianum]